MTYLCLALALQLLSAGGSVPDLNESAPLTRAAVTDLAAQADRLAVAGDIEGYSQLLSPDLTVTYAMSPDPDDKPHEYTREEYLATLRESLRAFRIRRCETSVGRIEIAPGGREATVESTVIQECVSRADGSVLRMTVQEKATLRIENGRLVIAGLAATLKDVSVERGEAGEDDKQPR